MKQKTFFLLLMFITLIVSGCQQKAASKKSTSTTNNPSLSCTGQAYWITPGCTGYCQYNPSAAICLNGGTTGTTSGGTTGGSTGLNCAVAPINVACPNYCQQVPKPYGCLSNGSNCNVTPNAAGCPGASVTVNPYWGIHYPPTGTPPAGTCSQTYVPEGVSSAFETRKGTITLAGLTTGSIEYSPFAPSAGNLLNTSPMLKSVGQAKIFFMTDSVLKLRVKVKPQPYAAQTTTMCYGRNMPGVTIPGYTKLQYYVKVYGVSAGNAVTYLGTKGPYTTGVNSCSDAIDLSEYQELSPTGVIVTIDQVKANQNCSGSFWTANGFSQCNLYKNVRSFDCWAMDFEVAADGTKTFD
ncbi:MAG: hypothetical protein H0V66_10510 [Bdellovibrionales bacterium]|nr:hypothetical protein [Bdellovibrionales bacterium]